MFACKHCVRVVSIVVKSQLNQHAYLQRLDIRWLKEIYIVIGTLIIFYFANYVLGDEMVTDAYQWELIEDGQVMKIAGKVIAFVEIC